MAVKLIRGKQITKFDTKKLANNPNFDVSKLKKPEPKVEVSGNVKDDTDIYGERKHYYTPDSNGNLKMEELMGKVLNKLDNIPGKSQTGTNAIEIDGADGTSGISGADLQNCALEIMNSLINEMQFSFNNNTPTNWPVYLGIPPIPGSCS